MPNPSFARVKEVFDEWAMYDAVIYEEIDDSTVYPVTAYQVEE
jgi:hypothetical protein